MSTGPVKSALAHLCRTVLVPHGAGASDGQLLTAFIERRDDAAFETLVRRHGPMVLGVCRRMLGNDHDADDAFQAAFVVLMRKATSVVPREAVANWLYGVAYQTAVRARSLAARRRGREKQVTPMPEPRTPEHDGWPDLQPLLDRELSRLPDKYRLPVVLCDLEGKTRKEAAHQLGWPEGSLSGRLSRARAMLAKRLTRHGVTLSAAALAALLAEHAAAAAVPAAVTAATLNAVKLGTAGAISVPIAILVEGVLKAMLLAKLKTMALVMALATFGAAVVTCAVLAGGDQGTGDRPGSPDSPSVQHAPPAVDPAPAGPKKPQPLDGLSARLVIRTKLPVEADFLDAALVLTNEGKEPLRLCTWCQQATMHPGTGRESVLLSAGYGKTKPERAAVTKSIVTLWPGESEKFPITLANIATKSGTFTFTASYAVAPEFGKEFKVWHGKIDAPPVVIPMGRPPAKQLALEAEARTRDGKPYVKVYLVNPSNIALEIIDRQFSRPPFAIEKLVTVSVDGSEARLISQGSFAISSKVNRMPLPAESKTLLGILAFDEQTAASFGGHTPTVVLGRAGALKPFPLAMGQRTITIRPASLDTVQYPAAVQPATVTIEIPGMPPVVAAGPGIKATVKGTLRFDDSKGLSVYVSVVQGPQKEETRVWFWMSEGLWKYWRDRMPALNGKEITVHGDLAQLPEGSSTSIPPRALYFQRFEIEGPEDQLDRRSR